MSSDDRLKQIKEENYAQINNNKLLYTNTQKHRGYKLDLCYEGKTCYNERGGIGENIGKHNWLTGRISTMSPQNNFSLYTST